MAKLYPPKNEQALVNLHQQITSSENIASHHKLSVLFYLLLDIDDLSDGTNKAESFAARAGVPAKYQVFMKGLWHMDRQSFAVALEYLTHPSLVPEFADDIILALARHAERADEDHKLPLAYYHTVEPVLKSPAAFEALLDAKARTNLFEAVLFARARPESMRELLFRRIITNVLSGPKGDQKAERASELVALPLDPLEERWFEEFLTEGDGKRLKAAKDTLMMRRIATGRVSNAGEKGTWGTVMESFRVGSGGRA